MNRFKEAKATFLHKVAFMKVRNDSMFLKADISILRALNHDLVKMFMILVVGDRIATKWHRAHAGHHKGTKMNYKQRVEAYCDWECARFTKPDKPLNGFQTWQKYFPEISMERINELYTSENFYNKIESGYYIDLCNKGIAKIDENLKNKL